MIKTGADASIALFYHICRIFPDGTNRKNAQDYVDKQFQRVDKLIHSLKKSDLISEADIKLLNDAMNHSVYSENRKRMEYFIEFSFLLAEVRGESLMITGREYKLEHPKK